MAENQTPATAPYDLLAQTNPGYDADLWCKLDELYEGGFRIVANAKRYLPQFAGETLPRYNERLQHASYENYLGAIADQYIGQLFAQELVVAPAADKDDPSTAGEAPTPDGFWQDFAANADLKGNDFVCVVKEAFTSALLKKRGLIGCDFPLVDAPAPENRAEEDAQGRARGYAFNVDVCELLDWEYDSQVQRVVDLGGGNRVQFVVGKLKFAVLKRCVERRDALEQSRDTAVEEFKVWSLDETGHAAWRLYRTEPFKKKDGPNKQKHVPLVDQGVTKFTEIPLVEICMPPALWLGNKLGPMAIRHFRGTSTLDAAVDRALHEIPYVKLGPEIGGVGEALPPDVQQNPARGEDVRRTYREAGMHVLGHQDEIDFAGPEGKALTIRADLLDRLVDAFYRVCHQMAASVSNTKKALGRSGDSKAADWKATAIILCAFGALVRDLSKRVYDIISAARTENVVWVVHGLEDYEEIDRAILVQEGAQAAALPIPSKTFRVEYLFRLAMAYLGNVPPQTQESIKQEIANGVVAEEAMRDIANEVDDEEPDADDKGTADGGSGGDGAGASREANGKGTSPS